MLEFSRVWKSCIYFKISPFLNLALSPYLFDCNLLLNLVCGEETVQILCFGMASFRWVVSFETSLQPFALQYCRSILSHVTFLTGDVKIN